MASDTESDTDSSMIQSDAEAPAPTPESEDGAIPTSINPPMKEMGIIMQDIAEVMKLLSTYGSIVEGARVTIVKDSAAIKRSMNKLNNSKKQMATGKSQSKSKKNPHVHRHHHRHNGKSSRGVTKASTNNATKCEECKIAMYSTTRCNYNGKTPCERCKKNGLVCKPMIDRRLAKNKNADDKPAPAKVSPAKVAKVSPAKVAKVSPAKVAKA